MSQPKISGDSVRAYLRDIGRIPLLEHDEEILLGRKVQRLMEIKACEELLGTPDQGQLAESLQLTKKELKKQLRDGEKAKDKMVTANLRLVVSVAKKYTKRNMELLDIIQEGTIGLVRGVEKLCKARQPTSLEIKIGENRDTSLIDLLEDESQLPDRLIERQFIKEDIRELIRDLPEMQAAVISMRYGIGEEILEPMSMTAIGQILNMSRDRVRTLEQKALRFLRERRTENIGYL